MTRNLAAQYLELTKPRVVLLIVFTALIGMLLAVPGLPPLRQSLAALNVGEIRIDGDRASVHCPREIKMAVLQALSSLNGCAIDLQMKEPSLEDVFLGYSG